ncbi:hypothetical protein HPB50_007345 [Hyalomma asiaticum]|uniref:Uncharacterized protein n=1 Tax=Hyalomma asiaticum TaxID=266040 RepID=A0ACB7STI8_HYAAI|nr:hypothetical protein HPB50_007345 [Hyalomma asiaticum]
MASVRLLVHGVLASIVLLQHVSHAQFDANLTLQSSFGHLRKRGRSLLRCWSEERDPAHIVFERPGGLPRASQRLLEGSESHSLMLPVSAGLSRAGLFSCRVDAGGIPTAVSTLKLPPTEAAQVEPLQAYVVAHVGETVHLSVTKRMHLAEPLVWRLEGMELPEYEGSETVTLVNVDQGDAGVYECHYRGQRDARLHAWIRLVVAGCPLGKFGPTCQDDCPPCRNGGMCHDTYGVCVCPAGFAGPNCDTPCGPNRVGANCDRVCTPADSKESERRGCALHVFCKPDPMSCSCAPGFKGLQCSQECLSGMFGENCTLKCHCWNGDPNCMPDGRCHDGCAAGWTGERCQQACSTNTFGPDCAYECHCAEDSGPCNPVSGTCSACEPGYQGLSCQEKCKAGKYGANCSESCSCLHGETCHHINGSCQCTGRHRGHSCDEMVPEVLTSEELEVDQGHPGSLECLVEAHPAPTVELSNQETRQNLTNVVVKDQGGGIYKASAPLPRSMEPGSYKFHCTARNDHGFDVGTLHVTILGPPELTSPPQVKVSADSAVASWEPSNSPTKKRGGRGNQIEYQLHVRAKSTGGNWTTAGPWQTAVRQSVSPLDPDTEYEFAVQLRRGKLTAWGPPVSVRTPCRADSPEAVPKDVVAKALSDRRISIRWEKPDPKILGCKLVGFEVHLSARNSPSKVQSLGADTVSTMVDDLDADSTYDVAVYAVTSVGRSMYSGSATAKTAQAVPGPVEHLTVFRTNTTEALITWDAPTGERHPHQLEYRVAVTTKDLGGCGRKGSEQFQIDGLVPHSWYEARVSASSGFGYGKRREVSFLTAPAPPSKPPGKVRVVWASSRSLHLSWEPPSCLDSHGPLLFYRVLYYAESRAENERWANTTDTNITLQDLLPFQKHTMRVMAVNSAGEGPLSPRVTASTTEDVPSAPEWLGVADVNGTSAWLSWQPPEEPNGVITGYEITVMAHADNDTEGNSSLLLATAVGPEVRELLLTQLSNGRSYTATVRATTSVGHGAPFVVHFSTHSLVEAAVQNDDFRYLQSMILWIVVIFCVAIFLLLVNVALVIIVSRRKHRSLEVSSGPFTSSTASTVEFDEFELSKHPAPGDTASDDGVFVDWTPPRSFQSTYI